MRLARLDLIAVGPFSGATLDFAGGARGVHIVYGPNEAGKSSSLRALSALLFGFPLRTTDNFRHRNAELRVGGRLLLADGQELAFVRRKGRKQTLIDPESGGAFAEEPLLAALAQLDEREFFRLYALDHQQLVAGGRQILALDGELAPMLFSVSYGLADLRKKGSALLGEAEALFSARASKRPLNLAIEAHRAAMSRLKAQEQGFGVWQERKSALMRATAALETVEQRLRATGLHAARIERVRRVSGPLGERSELLGQLAALPAVRELPTTFADEAKQAQHALEVAVQACQRLSSTREQLSAQGAAIEVSGGVIGSVREIEALSQQVALVEATEQELPLMRHERARLHSAADALERLLPRGLLAQEDGSLRHLLAQREWIDDLAGEHPLLRQQHEHALGVVAQLAQREALLVAEREGFDRVGVEGAKLRLALDTVRRGGELGPQLAEVRGRIEERQRRLDKGLVELGGYSGGIEGLARSPLPREETVVDFERRLDAVAQRIEGGERAIQALEATVGKLRVERDVLTGGDELPTVGALAALRAERQASWTELRRRAGQRAFELEDLSLIARFESQLRRTDELADALRSRASELGKVALIDAQLAECECERAEHERALAAARAEHLELQRAWRAEWAPLQIACDSPAAMREWLRRVSVLLEQWRELGVQEQALTRLQRLVVSHVELLSGCLSPGAAVADEAPLRQLAALLVRTEQVLADEMRRAECERRLQDCRADLRHGREQLQRVETRLEAWAAKWRAAVAAFAIGSSPDPAELRLLVERVSELVALHQQLSAKAAAIAKAEACLSAFTTRSRALVARHPGAPQGGSALDDLRWLQRELDANRKAVAERERLGAELAALDEQLAHHRHEADRARKQLAVLCQQGGVGDPKELPALSDRARRKHQLQQRLASLEGQLMRSGDGLLLDELLAEVAQVNPDGLEHELEDVREQLAEERASRDIARDHVSAAKRHLAEVDGGMAAAEAAQDAETHLAEIATTAADYLRLRMAARLLEGQLERYRKANQEPILARAGAFFSRITLGAFCGVEDDLDAAGRPTLFGLRAGGEAVAVAGMSEGTRDQLYLALRLATLERHWRGPEPLPLIVDDILVGFDDERAGACLELLAEVGAQAQIIVFSHHRRLAEQAASLGPERGVYLHQLRRRTWARASDG